LDRARVVGEDRRREAQATGIDDRRREVRLRLAELVAGRRGARVRDHGDLRVAEGQAIGLPRTEDGPDGRAALGRLARRWYEGEPVGGCARAGRRGWLGGARRGRRNERASRQDDDERR